MESDARVLDGGRLRVRRVPEQMNGLFNQYGEFTNLGKILLEEFERIVLTYYRGYPDVRLRDLKEIVQEAAHSAWLERLVELASQVKPQESGTALSSSTARARSKKKHV